MAVLAATKVGDRIPQGRYADQTFRVTTTAAAQADEWFDTGFSEVVAIVGHVTIGAVDAGANFKKNVGVGTTGTSGTEGANPGKVAIETAAAGSIVEVTVRGKV